MDKTLDFDLTQLSPLLQTNPNNVTQTHPIFSKTLGKYPEKNATFKRISLHCILLGFFVRAAGRPQTQFS